MQLRVVGRAATVAYMALILYLALAPAPDGPNSSSRQTDPYGVVGRRSGVVPRGWPGRARLALIVCALHGAATEVIRGRS